TTSSILSSAHILPPPRSTLFPYTMLFRSVTLPASTPCSDAGTRRGLLHRSTAGHPAQVLRSTSVPHSGVAPGGGVFRRGHLPIRSEEHTSELQSRENLVCRLLLDTQA